MTDTGQFSYQRDVPLLQPSQEAVEEMPIRRTTWRQFRRRVERLGELHGGTHGFNLMLWFFGIGTSALLSLVAATDDQQPWVLGILAVSLVGGAICWLWHLDMKKRIRDDVTDICSDMDEFEMNHSGMD